MRNDTETETNARKLVRQICKPAGCVYVDPKRDRCTQKYLEEVIEDFASDGCSQASLIAPGDIHTVEHGTSWVIPVTIFQNGSIKRHVDQPPIHKKPAKMF